ncbi:Putative type II secretion system protein F [Phycisphaerales bacterium]|nr:Putative type II secretion system protein F [Phycisphaerales bacterium]
MRFAYKGFDKTGKAVSDTLEAADRHEAAEILRRRGIFVSEIGEPRDLAASSAAGPVRKRITGKRLEQVAGFLRQLAVLVSTGTPVVEAIESLERQQKEGPFKAMLQTLRRRIEEGVQFSDAMSAHPEYFDGVCRSLIAAGESGGKLDVMLARLSTFTRQQVKVRKNVTGAMVYPCLLIVVAIVVTIAMLGFVLPRFEGLFKTLDTPLPPTTQVLMDISRLGRDYWYVVVGAAVGLPVGLKLWLATSGGAQAFEQFMLTAPQLGRLTRSYAVARFSRVLGVLLDGKVALLDAIRLTRQATGISKYDLLLARAEDAVTRGENFSVAINDPSLVPPSVIEAIRSGERSGRISIVLLTLADAMDEDNELALKTVTSLLEPLILIVLGLIVGSMAISMFLPLFDLTAAGGHG